MAIEKILGAVLELLAKKSKGFFSIAMGADYSFYVKSIATFAPTFFGYIISVLASVYQTHPMESF